MLLDWVVESNTNFGKEVEYVFQVGGKDGSDKGGVAFKYRAGSEVNVLELQGTLCIDPLLEEACQSILWAPHEEDERELYVKVVHELGDRLGHNNSIRRSNQDVFKRQSGHDGYQTENPKEHQAETKGCPTGLKVRLSVTRTHWDDARTAAKVDQETPHLNRPRFLHSLKGKNIHLYPHSKEGSFLDAFIEETDAYWQKKSYCWLQERVPIA